MTEPFSFDVVIIGGAYSGASVAIQLMRENPKHRVLIVERQAEFDRKVGEATTEVSGAFMTRVLNCWNFLLNEQLPKQGLRFWFSNSPDQPFEEMAEIGPRNNTRYAAFQLDRQKLDEHLLKLAVEAGAILWRPAKVEDLQLNGLGANQLTVKIGDEIRVVRARWVVDASGRAAMIARKQKIFHKLECHPTHALWARFRKVKDLDAHEVWAKYPRFSNLCRTARFAATNHMTGLGWWCWIIPLKGGDYSIGLVYDERLFQPPEGSNIGERLKTHFATHPFGREFLDEVEVIDNDMKAYSYLPYYSEKVFGDGWAIVGDAAGFLDPLYSPGLDFCSFGAAVVFDVLNRELQGEDVTALKENQNEQFNQAYHRWVDGIYRDKYYYIGESDLMSAALLMDVGAFFIGPVRLIYNDPKSGFRQYPYNGPIGALVGKFMALYNRRLAAIAKKRMAAGVLGEVNRNWRDMYIGFSLDSATLKLAWLGFRRWMRAEWRALFLKPKKMAEKELVPIEEAPAA